MNTGEYRLSPKILAEIESVIPDLEKEAADRRRIHEERYSKKWRIIADRQNWKCYGCTAELPATPIFANDGTGGRTTLPPLIFARKDVGDVIACRTCGIAMNGRSEEEFRAHLKLNEVIAEQKRTNPRLVSETEAAELFHMKPSQVRLLVAQGLSCITISGKVFYDRTEIRKCLDTQSGQDLWLFGEHTSSGNTLT